MLHLLTGRWTARVVVLLGIIASGALIALGGSATTSNDPAAGLPADAQSTAVQRLQAQLPSARTTPALVVYSRGDGTLTDADRAAIDARSRALTRVAVDGQVAPAQVSPDGRVALVAVPLANDPTGERISADVKALRNEIRADLPTGLTAQVTGAAGFTADINDAFSGANVTLLLVTVLVVAVLLIATYRSPVLWLVPLVVVALADQVAGALIAIVSRHSDVVFSQATTGIVEVLVFGAGTDYALLLIARYREELRRVDDRRDAMRRALRSAGPAILASGTTVVLALLSLVFAVLGDDRALGIAGAIGIATAVVFGLVLLPAALVVFPRGIFWPLVPRNDERGRRANEREGRVWRRIGEGTARRPWPVTVGSVVVLGVLCLGLLGTTVGLSQADTFRTRAESVDGLTTLSRSFPAGAADPVAVLTPDTTAQRVADVAARVPGVAGAAVGESGGGNTQVDVVLSAAPDTAASYDAIRALRSELADVPGTYVGGSVATTLDTKTAATRDLHVIAPVILAVVLVVLLVLLRSLVAPVLLIGTVVLTYFAALGAASWSFRHVFGFAGLDAQVPLLSFLFLVALGVDYNIFLATRAREEAARVGTRRGIIDALAVTGGVITSAGILLAAVFAVLGVLPVIVLTEIGVIVCIGVLLDTLLVRTVLVPALVQVLGERFWWPGRPAAAPAPRSEEPRRELVRE